MALWERDYMQAYDEKAVSSFATKVYGWMTAGLLTTALVAYWIVSSGLYVALMPYWLVPTIGTFVLAMVLGRAVTRMQFGTMAGLFLLYSGLQGVFFGIVLPLYAAQFGGEVIWSAFATAGVIFGGAVCYGIFTKADLTSLGKILRVALMGLVGITLLYLVLSLFMPVSGFMLMIAYLGLVLFVGMTAYDAQQIRRLSTQLDGSGAMAAKLSLMMALKMYLNVIMIFWYLLQILSSRRR